MILLGKLGSGSKGVWDARGSRCSLEKVSRDWNRRERKSFGRVLGGGSVL
jgi:hypothetical protein